MTKKKSLLISLAVIFTICFTASIILSILFAENEKPTLNSFGGITENSNSTALDQSNQCSDCELKTFTIQTTCPICYGTGMFIATIKPIVRPISSNIIEPANNSSSKSTRECSNCHGTGVLNGGTITVAVTKTECTHCQDSQKQGKLECQDCNGNGHLKHDMEWFFFVEKCKDCGGVNPINGNMHSQICNSNDCSNCNGTGFIDCEHCDNGWQYEVCTTCGGDHILD